ncbi:MAG: branched-chain amino acid ABC transporter permease, partial [Candidatus Heimdallarchaeota archaeon]|nr:branched-chain amino acid ABC transporter permease [Candidatus Heimdallarchaeota archaeon]
MKINWSYYYDEISDRVFYILGFILIVSLPFMKDWIIIGEAVTNAQQIGILPNNANLTSVLVLASIFAIFAASWDLVSGFSGQISFGHALFLGMGGYFSIKVKRGLVVYDNEIFPGMENNFQEIGGIIVDVAMLQAIFIASILTLLFAALLGILTLRLKGPYFALVTLVLPLIARILVTKRWKDVFGGDSGLP